MGSTLTEKILKAHLVDGEYIKGQEIGIRYGWSKVPKIPAVKNLTTTVSGENLEVDYDTVVR